ncbi:hypothetical protein I7I48_10801 [Histoplasma ohiense]|nr:hypothetical protein I7I48_10801 [Histoplasma ohiense (nom. inval.)]
MQHPNSHKHRSNSKRGYIHMITYLHNKKNLLEYAKLNQVREMRVHYYISRKATTPAPHLHPQDHARASSSGQSHSQTPLHARGLAPCRSPRRCTGHCQRRRTRYGLWVSLLLRLR